MKNGLPISRSIFKNFRQNFEGKFIKSSSKSKALNSFACTTDLFISSYPHYMDLADPCGNHSWSSQSIMCHHNLCDLFHGIHGV